MPADAKTIDYANIPVQADIIAGIIGLDPDSNSCFRDLDSYVRSDQGVATLALRVVNSPLYSRGKKIATIPMAISVLGFNVVRSLAMLAFSRSLFSQTHNPLFKVHIWQHSLLTAIAGQTICQGLGCPGHKDDAFIAGLMHDMGKVLLFTHDQARYLHVLALVMDQGLADTDAERQVFGFDHCEVGREAAVRWKLPERFAEYMGTDLLVPRPDAGADPVLHILALANFLVASAGVGARSKEDAEARRTEMMAFGADAAQCDAWLQPDFMVELMSNDTYQLCANV